MSNRGIIYNIKSKAAFLVRPVFSEGKWVFIFRFLAWFVRRQFPIFNPVFVAVLNDVNEVGNVVPFPSVVAGFKFCTVAVEVSATTKVFALPSRCNRSNTAVLSTCA